MRLPNFLVIGAAKCATTSLWEYMRQHPQVFMPALKEPAYFAFPGRAPSFSGPGDLQFNVVTDWDRYCALFDSAGDRQAVGEASTQYISCGEPAVQAIDAALPGVRLIAVLRHPADRAQAHYNHWVRRGVETEPSLQAAIEREAERRSAGYSFWWQYREQGKYAEQLAPYFARFGRERMRIVLYEDLTRAPQAVLRELFDFIGVDSKVEVDVSTKHNLGSVPKSRLLHRLLVRPNAIKSLAKRLVPAQVRAAVTPRLMQRNKQRAPKLDPAARAALTDWYRSDILRLQELIGRDLSHWLTD